MSAGQRRLGVGEMTPGSRVVVGLRHGDYVSGHQVRGTLTGMDGSVIEVDAPEGRVIILNENVAYIIVSGEHAAPEVNG